MDTMRVRAARSALRRGLSVVVAVGALFVAAAGCATDRTDSAADDIEPAVLPAWNDPSFVSDLGDGWTVAACEGDAPFLCVANRGTVMGTIEAIRFPIASFEVADPAYDDPTNLRAIASDFTQALQADRLVGCGADYGFRALPVQPFTIGGVEGLNYGFIGTNPDGSPSETNLQYSFIQGEDRVLITAIAYDEGGCPGRDDLGGFDSATLLELRSRLESTLQRMSPPTA